MKNTFKYFLILFFVVFGLAAVAGAEALTGSEAGPSVLVTPASESFEPMWGTQDSITHIVPAWDFLPQNSTITYAQGSNRTIYETSSSGDWWITLRLPTGVLLNSIELEACDTSATGRLQFGLARFVSPVESSSNITPVGDTGTAETPGCDFYPLNLNTPETIDNANNVYLLFLNWTGTTSATRVQSFRAYYKLQTSPAPSTATFGDVPTSHPFFQYVEAMFASGITSGCGGGNYCPNSSVTRGQMAVFLSRAVGLHFPN